MARNYGSYNDSDSSGNSSDYDDNGQEDKTLKLTPHAEIEGVLTKVFGNSNSWGQSLAVKFNDVTLVDGCLYHDPEKDNYKVFSWKDVVGMNPGDGDFDASDANQFLVKTYGTKEKRYELVEAVHPDNDEPVEIGNVILWYGGSDENGPKSASKTLAQILTESGRDMVIRDANGDVSADVNNWLTETSGSNVLRSDLQDRRFAFFEVKKPSNTSDRMFNHPIVEDVETGQEVATNNNADESSQGTLEGEKAAATDGGQATVQPSRREELEGMDYSDLQSLGSETEGATGSGTSDEIVQSILDAEDGVPAAQSQEGVPEPINDFVTSVAQFDDFNSERAATLLEDFITDDGLPLTQDLVDDFGGQDAVLAEAGF